MRYTQEQIDHFIDGFEHSSATKEEWTHDAHLIVALWYNAKLPEKQALDFVREKIKALNIATGGQNTDTNGYHETMTRAWMWIAKDFYDSREFTSIYDAINAFVTGENGHRDYVLKFFTKEHLFTKEARLGVKMPNVHPMPGPFFEV